MALVITLILLSVTLIMAVAFLAVSRRERNAVTTTTDTATARLAADAALANAKAQIVASIFATNAAAYNFGLLVSTNYINGLGFQTGVANPTNVDYNYPGGAPISGNDLIQNVANLLYLPRAPVYLSNLVTHAVENRFYLDLNRNGVDDPNGWVTNRDNNGNFILDGSGNPATNLVVGDPEWIGLLDHPDAPHGPNNRFVSRYAFIAVPVGNTLDINAIHNQVLDENNADPHVNPAANSPVNTGRDFFLRNEGVGSWEINLAAFLADLNTNRWGRIIDIPPGPPSGFYFYNQPNGNPNIGAAFDDARALLAYRYANNYSSQASVDSLYGGVGSLADLTFRNDNINGYSDGFLQTGFRLPVDKDNPRLPWAGADNTNQFFSLPSELFDTSKTEIGATFPGFSDRLLAAGTNTFGGSTVPTYDRYTFYRMLDQLGSDSAPDSGKINLNYSNAVVNITNGLVANIAVVPNAETNFIAWTATNFFLVAADRLLRTYTTNWFQGSPLDCYTNYTGVTNVFFTDPSNYLATYYGIHTNYFSYIDSQGRYIWNAPNGFGLTNLPLYGMVNQIPAFGVTNIPVVINNRFVYTPAVNRLLQLAANIYDSVNYYSNYVAPGATFPATYLPTVFRPIFNVTNELNINGVLVKDVYVCGYIEVNERVDIAEPDAPLSVPWDLSNPTVLNILNPGIHNQPAVNPLGTINVFGVPMIVGAKKGFPNFNEFYMENAFQLTRKMLVTRATTNSTYNLNPNDFGFFQMFNLSLTNSFGVEFWNSYRSNYTRPTDIFVNDYMVVTLTNFGGGFSSPTSLIASASVHLNTWPGYNPAANPLLAPLSFKTNFVGVFGNIPTNFAAIPVSMYRFNTPPDAEEPGHVGPYVTTNLTLPYEINVMAAGHGPYPQPHWGMTLNNNLQAYTVDTTSGRLLDYVQLGGPSSVRDLTAEIQRWYDTGYSTKYDDLWETNYLNNQSIPIGIANQFAISQGNGTPTDWSQGSDQTRVYNEINGFRVFLMGPDAFLVYPPGSGYVPDASQIGIAESTNQMQMPYTPSALVVQDIDWQANDPLVHYAAGDLVSPTAGPGLQSYLNWPGNLGILNDRYLPWGGNPLKPSIDAQDAYNVSLKDPLVYRSDDWNFPTNKFPTVGWLGRVHRGTPWQTVYMKAPDVNLATWVTNWTGNVNSFDAANEAPRQDYVLFDLFTTAFNDNATRGQLPVNVAADRPEPAAGLAAWSALFSGIMVLSNNASDTVVQSSGQAADSMTNFIAFPISPAGPGTNSALWQLVQGIYNTRTNLLNPDGMKGTFEHVGQILAVPQLTVASPFLHWHNGNVLDTVQQQKGISDEMYEWLPQQMMSLLRDSSPRYVVYCYGQALKPAPNSLVTSGAYFQMCTNYQVVAESAARAIVRVDGANTPTPHVVVESYNPLPPD